MAGVVKKTRKPQRPRKSTAVCITGVGAATPFGQGVDRLWAGLVEGRDVFGPIRLFSTAGHRTAAAAEIQNLPPFDPKRLSGEVLSRADFLALSASQEALENAGLIDPVTGRGVAPGQTGVLVGTAAGAILGLESFFRNRVQSEHVPNPRKLLSSFALSAIATNIAKEFQLEGVRMTFATVCSSSGLALAAGLELLRREELDHVLVVGTETLSEVVHGGFNSLRSVSPDRCRPFDLNRKGLVLGEGAGAAVIERNSTAKGRGALPLAFLTGYGLATDLHHFTAPQPDGRAVAKTVRMALANAGVSPDRIDHVNAHGTGTPLNDSAEARGLRAALGRRSREAPVFSIKGAIGHTLGAASILEAVTSIFSLKHGIVPPTAGLETPDPECRLNFTQKRPQRAVMHRALSNSLAFGGSNLTLVFRKDGGQEPPGMDSRERSKDSAVITGIGVVSPVGVGRKAFEEAVARGRAAHASLCDLSSRWSGFKGGVVDMNTVREKVPATIRRRMNRQASFLFSSLTEALSDAGVDPAEEAETPMSYGSAFGCSGNVHRYFSQLLEEGPRFASPNEFNMSVTNAPPAIVAQALGLGGPLWVFVGDEASWESALHWAANAVAGGKARRILVSAAEELSESIVAIHHALGLLEDGGRSGLTLGEGAVSMVVESLRSAQERGAGIYGSLAGWKTVQDVACGPIDFSLRDDLLVQAATRCMDGLRSEQGEMLLVTPQNGIPEIERVTTDAIPAVKSALKGVLLRPLAFRALVGESGIAGGLGLAAFLLDRSLSPPPLGVVLTSARGGVLAATSVRRQSRQEKGGRTSHDR